MADRPPFGRVAIVGVPGAGKTTLFSALSGLDYARAMAGSGKVIGAGVRVEHPRLMKIHQAEEPQSKLTCPTLELFDTPPLVLEGQDKDRNPSVLHQLREMTGLVIVLRAYDLGGSVEEKKKALASQLEGIRGELLLNDADALQRRLEKIVDRLKRSIPTAEREQLEQERDVIGPLVESCMAGNPKALVGVPEATEKALRSFALFSRKPMVTVANLGENDLGAIDGIALKLEQELLAMAAEERTSYMADYGLKELATPKLPMRIQEALGFLTFLTVGPTETVGWPLRAGAAAPEGAAVIHTDLQKGFVNVEVIAYAEYERCGTVKDAERTGKRRIEGKNYVMQDFDIIHVRSSK